MRSGKLPIVALVLSVSFHAQAGDKAPAAARPPATVPAAGSTRIPASAAAESDPRYPVPLSSDEAARQKGEMRNNLIALRLVLAGLADKDFAVVEESLRGLAHQGPASARPGASTTAFRNLERGFEQSVDKTLAAARGRDGDAVLRALGDTLSYCQSCHMAFRQQVSVVPEAGQRPPQQPPVLPKR